MPFVVIALCWGVETLKNAAASSGCFGRKSTRRLEKCAVLAEFSASTAHFFRQAYASYPNHSTTFAEMIRTSAMGRSFGCVGTLCILPMTLKPFITSPKTVYCPSRCGVPPRD